MHDSRDEAVAEPSAAAASPPDANVLEIRASAADAILGFASFQKAEAATARRLPPLFERLLIYGPRAAWRPACLVSQGWQARIFLGVSCRFTP
jgi:hypothetical protein